MGYNDEKEHVYHSLEELTGDPTLSEEERTRIMTKGKTTVQIDATHQKTVWVRTNSQTNNTYRNQSNSKNTSNGTYNNNK